MSKKVIVFDFDGVILESVSLKDQAFFDLFADATLSERERVLILHRNTPGIKRRDKITLLLAEGLGRQATPEAVESALGRFAELVGEKMQACPEVPGVRSFLDDVAGKFRCYVVSAAPQDELREIAAKRDLSKYFIDILGSPAPKAELLQQVVDREQIPAGSILFIGDKISDFRAAREVGVHFWGRNLPDNPTLFPADVPVFDDFLGDARVRIKKMLA